MAKYADDDADKSSARSVSRTTYSPPVLVKWGTLRDLTQAVGNSGKSDSGKKSGQKNTR
jgi:hypothetical protein